MPILSKPPRNLENMFENERRQLLEGGSSPKDVGNMLDKARYQVLVAAVKRANEKLPAAVLPIQVIDKSNFTDHLNNKDIDERYHNSRYQLIVNWEGRYTTFDIDKRDGKKSLICLDAVNHGTAERLRVTALMRNYNVFNVSGFTWEADGRLQHDLYSCSMFAFDHSVQLAHTNPDFHTTIAKKANVDGDLRWDDLPPNFLWNAQSNTTLDHYKAKMKGDPCLDEIMHNGLSYNQYIAQGVCTFPKNGEQITQNQSINIHTLSSAVGLREYEIQYQNLKQELITLKVGPNDKEMDNFLAKCEAAINQDPNIEKQLENLKLQIATMSKVIEGLDSPENKEVKNIIHKFDERNKFWTIGMDKKARNIEAALMNVPIEERANLLQSKDPSVTTLLKAIASKRITISNNTTNEKGQIVEDQAANSFKDFKKEFIEQIKERADVAANEDLPRIK